MAMSDILSFLGTPEGIIGAIGVSAIAAFHAWKKYGSSDDIETADLSDSIPEKYFDAIKRHGKNENRPLVQNGRHIGVVWRMNDSDDLSMPDRIRRAMGKDVDSEDSSVLRLLVRKKKRLHRIVAAVPLLRKIVLETYIVSKENIRNDISAIIIDPGVSFDRFAGIWIDSSADSAADIQNAHALDLLQKNMERNEDFANRMIALDPATAQQRVLIAEDYGQKSAMYDSKKKKNHG